MNMLRITKAASIPNLMITLCMYRGAWALPDTTFSIDNTNKAKWHEAKRICASKDMVLATVINQQENDDIRALMIRDGIKYLWIGANDLEEEGSFTWVDGEPLNYTKWGRNQPQSSHNEPTENCVVVEEDGTWHDYPCERVFHFCCKTQVTLSDSKDETVPLTAELFVDSSNNTNEELSKIFLISHIKRKSWQDAERLCANNSMQLATVNNQQENEQLKKLMVENDIPKMWIGANDLKDHGRFTWADGTPLNYTKWGAGQPQFNTYGLAEQCVAMEHGTWHDYTCANSFHFVCEIRPTRPNTYETNTANDKQKASGSQAACERQTANKTLVANGAEAVDERRVANETQAANEKHATNKMQVVNGTHTAKDSLHQTDSTNSHAVFITVTLVILLTFTIAGLVYKFMYKKNEDYGFKMMRI